MKHPIQYMKKYLIDIIIEAGEKSLNLKKSEISFKKVGKDSFSYFAGITKVKSCIFNYIIYGDIYLIN